MTVVVAGVLSFYFVVCFPLPLLLSSSGPGPPGAPPSWLGLGRVLRPLPCRVGAALGGSCPLPPCWVVPVLGLAWWGGSPPLGALSPPWGWPLCCPPGPLGLFKVHALGPLWPWPHWLKFLVLFSLKRQLSESFVEKARRWYPVPPGSIKARLVAERSGQRLLRSTVASIQIWNYKHQWRRSVSESWSVSMP